MIPASWPRVGTPLASVRKFKARILRGNLSLTRSAQRDAASTRSRDGCGTRTVAAFLWLALQPLWGAEAVTNLRCGFATNPLGVDEATPRLSWQLEAATPVQRGLAQTAYEILVATSRNALAVNHGDLWDSHKVNSDSTLSIAYAGKPLTSEQQVFWKVRAWDQNNRQTDWSPVATWTMGLLQASDWQGGWICASSANSALPLFRRAFAVRPGLKRAVICLCGLGQYELFANGMKVGDALLAPGWSKYDKTCLYDTFDLTASLIGGTNVLGVMLGNGMYRVEGGPRYTKFTGSFGPPRLIAQLHLFYQDGTSEVVPTDAQWRTAPGPITFSGIYGGEDFDARLEPADWKKPGFDGSTWLPAVMTNSPGGVLHGVSYAAPAIKASQTLQPIHTNAISAGKFVFDFGQNAALMPRLTTHGETGAIVRIIPAELINPDGTVNRGSAGGGTAYWQYTLSGSGTENWLPQFFYQGSRYFQVELLAAAGSSQLPSVDKLDGMVIQSTSPAVGEFACSNDLFNHIHTLIRWAQRANMVSVLTDCPHRERLGWLEQYHLNGPSLRYEFDLAQLFTKGMNDMADSQLADGLVPDIAPEYTVFSGGFRDSPEWGSAFVIVPWQQYQFTGDLELLARHYKGMKHYVAYLGTKAKDRIVSHGLGDWYDIGPGAPGYSQLTPIPLTATAFYYYDTWILAQAAALLQQTEEAKAFSAQADEIRAAFNQRFFNATTHSYATGSQCANAIPLVMNLCEPTHRAGVLDAIVADVRQHGNAITAGDVGYRYLLRALAEGGRSDVIFDMNNQSEKPGYGYQLKRGATSLTEAWDANPASSQNHFMLGQIMEWFYADLAGIASDPDGPGFKRILIRPQPVGDVTWVKAAYDSVHGRITCDWEKSAGKFTLHLNIPANTTATVYLPAPNAAGVTEGGRAASEALGVHFLRQEKDRAVYHIGSGIYYFVAE